MDLVLSSDPSPASAPNLNGMLRDLVITDLNLRIPTQINSRETQCLRAFFDEITLNFAFRLNNINQNVKTQNPCSQYRIKQHGTFDFGFSKIFVKYMLIS